MPKQKNQKGVTILIAVLILSSVVILALAVADVVGRSNRTSKGIGFSEVAYFAAEHGVEDALYSIERNRTVPDSSASGDLTDISEAHWERTAGVLFDAEAGSMTCAELESMNEGLCVGNWKNNVNKETINVKLDGVDRTFQLELDFSGLATYLPSNISIEGITASKASTTIFYLDTNEIETLTNPSEFNNISVQSRRAVLKITSKDDDGLEFDITTGSANNLIPLGFRITSTGTYKEQKRVIEVQRKNWQIY